jgi:hypothetical protein
MYSLTLSKLPEDQNSLWEHEGKERGWSVGKSLEVVTTDSQKSGLGVRYSGGFILGVVSLSRSAPKLLGAFACSHSRLGTESACLNSSIFYKN